MVEIGVAEYFDIGGALRIIGTMFVVLYYSRKQAQGLSADIGTKILNDLDEKVRKMSEIIIEKPSMQKVIYKLEKPDEELALYTISCLFVPMYMLCIKEKCLMTMSGQDGYIG
ncbi:MAG: hypothetical protein M3297_15770 [Thermoproteota archaeon]|nr:hypothetical protein [Thermoproteota archaeon]